MSDDVKVFRELARRGGFLSDPLKLKAYLDTRAQYDRRFHEAIQQREGFNYDIDEACAEDKAMREALFGRLSDDHVN
jgi:hypothetical protein